MVIKRVENELFLVKETSSGAVLNTDKCSYEAIRQNKLQKKEKESDLKKEIEDLRAMLMMLLERQSNGNNHCPPE